MAHQRTLLPPRSKDREEVCFYAYVLGGVLDLRWNVETMQNPALYQVVKDFLTYLYGTDEWQKLKVLDAIRDKTRNEVRDEARYTIPSLFINKAAWPLALPKEAPNAKFEIDYIYKLRDTIQQLKKVEEPMESQNDNAVPTTTNAPRFHLPANVTVEQLTLENFRSLTGRRFRVTTEQQNRITAGTLTRDGAFAEFIVQVKENQ